MKTSLEHLPEEKIDQLEKIKNLVLDKVPDVDKIILFGSYATGEWVEDRQVVNDILYEYLSDFDILIIPRENHTKEYLIQDRIVNSWKYHTPLTPIVHNIEYINEGLEKGQYFFIDIIKEGILLYDQGIHKFSKPKELLPDEQRKIAQTHYNQWYQNGKEFLEYAQFGLEQKRVSKKNLVMYHLHQAAENFYSATLLIFSGYKPKTHNLNILREYAKPYSKELYFIFSPILENEEEVKLFSLLKRSYVEARYDEKFEVDPKDIKEIMNRIKEMSVVVEKICWQKINKI